MKEPIRKVLWSAASQQASNSTITLNDSIDNYDELWFYGSGTRNAMCPCIITEYPVIPGVLNLGGPFFVGQWGSGTNNYELCNGTQIYLSGNSGLIATSFYFGKANGSTAWAAANTTNRDLDVRPYKILGIKYKNDTDSTIVWSSTGSNLYNTDITLSESINHFDNLIVYGSGYETGTNGCHHAGKVIFQVQDASKVMNVGVWAYTPWKYTDKHNLVIGQELLLKGNSGHIRSAYYWGMGSNTTAYAAGRWATDYSMSAIQPYKIVAYGRHPSYRFIDETTEGGSVSSNINPGYSGDVATLTAIPASEDWKCSAIDITGATLTGNDFMFENSNVTASAGFEHSRELTLENGEHGVLSADKMTGFSGDVVSVDATTDEGWYLSAVDLTGAEATGFQFTFTGSDITALGKYTDAGFPVIYLSDDHVHLTGDVEIFTPGSEGITLDSGYDQYYRISGYDITGGSIIDGKLVPTGSCVIKAVETPNYFTATGEWEKGSNVDATARSNVAQNTTNVGQKYAIHGGHTGDIPTAWYSASNRWKITSEVSGYSITLNPKMTFYRIINGSTASWTDATGLSLIGSTQTQSQSFSWQGGNSYKYYDKTFTSTATGVTYGISGRVHAWGYDGGGSRSNYATARYVATGTTGTWTATGIAP